MRELALILNTDKESIHRILTMDLQMKKLGSVSTVLSEKNKKDRIACCERILRNVSVSKSDVCCVQDELWVDLDVVRTKNSSKTWLKKGAKRQQISKPKLTPQKTMLLVSFT